MAIWNLGSINIDHVYRLDHLPRPGETLAARSYVQGLGGKGANQSIAAARAGAITHHIGAMGAGEADALFAALPGELPVQGLLITRGGEGAEYRDMTTGTVHRQAAFAVNPVDTTGAGDTFAGYFAAALDRGDPIPAALRLAAGAAALKVTRPGAGDAIPGIEEVIAFIANRG